MFNALGNVVLWPVMLVLMTLIRWSIFPTMDAPHTLSNFFSYGLVFSIIGTLILAFTLPIQRLRIHQQHSGYDVLRTIYGDKRKRDQSEETANTVNPVELGDDGELIQQPEITTTANSSK